MTLKREDITCLCDIKSVDSDSSSNKSTITPFSLRRCKSESDLYMFSRKVPTFGSPLTNDSIMSPQKEKQIYIINGDYKCVVCDNLISIKHNFISFSCNKCFKYYIKSLNKFIIK